MCDSYSAMLRFLPKQLKGGQFDVGASLDSAEIRVTACHPRGELWYEYYTDLGSYVGSKLAENIDVAIGDFGIMAEDVEKINPDRTEAWISRGRKVELSLELNPQNPIKEQA